MSGGALAAVPAFISCGKKSGQFIFGINMGYILFFRGIISLGDNIGLHTNGIQVFPELTKD
jgi:hypothetical protein